MAWGNIVAQPMYGDRHLEPEQEMWIAVLARAVHDAFGSLDYLEASKAIAWFKSNSKDFRDVCEMAGRDPKYVHRKLIKEVLLITFKEIALILIFKKSPIMVRRFVKLVIAYKGMKRFKEKLNNLKTKMK